MRFRVVSAGAATFRAVVALSALFFLQSVAAAATYVATPSNYRSLVSLLLPGDTLVLEPGRYGRGLSLHNLNGTPENAIVIKGSRSGAAILVARRNANTISIVNSSYVEVRDLVLDGNGLFVDAVKAEGNSSWAHHITLEGLTIYRYGAHQQNSGISTKCPAWGWVIRNNVIKSAGTGMYLGDSDGSAPFCRWRHRTQPDRRQHWLQPANQTSAQAAQHQRNAGGQEYHYHPLQRVCEVRQ